VKILIIKRYERNFRIPFYQLLRKKLKTKDIEFDLYYGEPNNLEKKSIKDYIKDDSVGNKVNNKYKKIRNIYLCYQPCLSLAIKSDLVIVQQGNRELLNYILLIRKLIYKNPKIIFWGHGRNFQGNPKSLKERFKKWYSNKVDFWFAYNDLSKKLLIDRGFDQDKIISLNNTLDTKSVIEYFDKITDGEKTKLKHLYAISDSDPVGIFCASIYKDKEIDFLLKALEIVKSKAPGFKFFMIGRGVEESKVIEFNKKNPEWFYYLGNKFGQEKINYFAISDFQAIPGAVGLNIIDSFSFLCPLITTKIDNHGPEISYLIDNKNGLMTDFIVENYAESILLFIRNSILKNKLKDGCIRARNIYSIENMTENFIDGIQKILSNNKV
jgi:glycosyltransferase involved in cell wall biosynthesis